MLASCFRQRINGGRNAIKLPDLASTTELDKWARQIVKTGVLKNDFNVFTVSVPDDKESDMAAFALITNERYLAMTLDPAVMHFGTASIVGSDGRRLYCLVLGH